MSFDTVKGNIRFENTNHKINVQIVYSDHLFSSRYINSKTTESRMAQGLDTYMLKQLVIKNMNKIYEMYANLSVSDNKVLMTLTSESDNYYLLMALEPMQGNNFNDMMVTFITTVKNGNSDVTFKKVIPTQKFYSEITYEECVNIIDQNRAGRVNTQEYDAKYAERLKSRKGLKIVKKGK